MKISLLPNGEFRLDSKDKSLLLSFPLPTVIHVREVESKPSRLIGKLVLLTDDIDYRVEGNQAIFETSYLRLTVDENLLLHAYFQAEAVLDEKAYAPKQDEKGFALKANRPIYGLGDKTGPLDKRGYSYINWNSDIPEAHVDTSPSLYKSINFFIAFDPTASMGVFLDNSFETRFDFNKAEPEEIRVSYQNGAKDVYYFFGSLSEVIAAYTALLGRNTLPPRFALGTQQSRWSYNDKKEVEEVIAGYRQLGIPLSTIYLDIAYMDHYKDFTVDECKFPDVQNWLNDLKKQGIHIIPIIDAGVKAEEGYRVYDEGVKEGHFCTLNGEVYHNEVWPGDSVFPSFPEVSTRIWWSLLVRDFLRLGFDGIWNDMNEPASFRGPLPNDVDMGGIPHLEAHNLYAHYMNQATHMAFLGLKKRPYIVTRAACAGTQRFASTWTGDNQSIWDHLRLMIPQLCNLAMSGFVSAGVDIGGFGGDATPELLARWAEAAVFNPIFRNHSSLDTKRQEPYFLDGKEFLAYRNAVLTRYQLIPSLYTALFEAESAGKIALRPLIYNFPKDERAKNENTELMLGDAWLLAPALFPGQETRAAYFPAPFYRFCDGKRFEKGDQLIPCPLGEIPLFLREKSVVVLPPKKEKLYDFPSLLRLCWTEDGPAKTFYYEDSGEGLDYQKGEYNLFEIRVSKEEGLAIVPLHEGMPTHIKEIQLEGISGQILLQQKY